MNRSYMRANRHALNPIAVSSQIRVDWLAPDNEQVLVGLGRVVQVDEGRACLRIAHVVEQVSESDHRTEPGRRPVERLRTVRERLAVRDVPVELQVQAGAGEQLPYMSLGAPQHRRLGERR